MITYHQFCRIKDLHNDRGLTTGQIARELSLDRKTVKMWIAEDCYKKRRSPRRGGLLDPFMASINKMLTKPPLSAIQIFQRLRDDGYGGGYTLVKDYVRLVRPVEPKAFSTLHFDPGEYAQADFGECGLVQVGNIRRKYYVFVITLCWSRLAYIEFTMKQTMEHVLQCHRNAFEFFGRVPRKIMVDNARTMIQEHPPVGTPIPNPRYKDLADHYDFKIKACAPGKGNEKGRVENGVKYVKMNFINGLNPPNFSFVQAAGREWLDNIANVRTHATTRRRPVDMFGEEQAALGPLPPIPYDCSVTKPISSDKLFRISFDGNRYSVSSEYSSQKKLTLHILPERLTVYSGDDLIAAHSRCYERGRDIEDPKHPMKVLERKRTARKQKLQKLFLSISPAAEAYYQGLKEKRLRPWDHLRNIIALMEVHGREKVNRAIEEAVHFRAFSSEFIINYLQRKTISDAVNDPLHLPRKQDLLEIILEQPNLDIFDKLT